MEDNNITIDDGTKRIDIIRLIIHKVIDYFFLKIFVMQHNLIYDLLMMHVWFEYLFFVYILELVKHVTHMIVKWFFLKCNFMLEFRTAFLHETLSHAKATLNQAFCFSKEKKNVSVHTWSFTKKIATRVLKYQNLFINFSPSLLFLGLN